MDDRLIFLTNDDGVAARGLANLITVAREFGRVVVVAPEISQSGMSHAITMGSPLFLRMVRKEPGLDVYACSGTPVDCVKMAFDHLLRDQRVDMVCSGINHGSNAAINVLYSGTMGAAIEGGFYEVPSVGFSLTDHSDEADFRASSMYARRIISKLFDSAPRTPLCLNVNIPVGAPESINGLKVVRQCRGFWREEFFSRKDPRDKDYYWLTGAFQNAEPDAEDTDEWALAHNFVSVVPVQVDLTNHRQVVSLGGILDE